MKSCIVLWTLPVTYTMEFRIRASCLSLFFVAITEYPKLSDFNKNKVYLAQHYKDGKLQD